MKLIMATATSSERSESIVSNDDSQTTGSQDSAQEPLFADGRYRLLGKIGEGAFGDIYKGISLSKMHHVAIKLEHQEVRSPQLANEAKVYKYLNKAKVIGFPRIHWYGPCGQGYNALVMDLLGPTLGDMFNFCAQKFTLKTVLMIALQLIDRVHQLHRHLYIHRDLKPSNFIFGRGSDRNKLFLTDLGLTKRYLDPQTLSHIELPTDSRIKQPFVGSSRFSSINTQSGRGQSRRDDLESIGYILIYLMKGRLPWQGIRGVTTEQKHEKILQKKLNTPVQTLCRGLPHEFAAYMTHVRKLKFDQDPDYDFILDLFRKLMETNHYEFDYQYDWYDSYDRARENRAKAGGH